MGARGGGGRGENAETNSTQHILVCILHLEMKMCPRKVLNSNSAAHVYLHVIKIYFFIHFIFEMFSVSVKD